jgi:hypothetical protein
LGGLTPQVGEALDHAIEIGRGGLRLEPTDEQYRALKGSRKSLAKRFFAGLDIVHTTIAWQGFGRFWIATEEAVQELAACVQLYVEPRS